MIKLRFISLLFLTALSSHLMAQLAPTTFKNPILPGFHPDPSICRVGDDYYMATSSFTWYPGLPIYHSKDLVNWQLLGHAIDRPNMVTLNGLNDNDGIYAPTLRYHEGVFYLITTVSKGGGNFYITATDPRGPWSDPVWLKEAGGIDPSLFFDDDGKCYYTGNAWDFPGKSWRGQCAIWLQELDLTLGKLIGERKNISIGHALNAAYTEAPHLYKINGKYLLIVAEGGTDEYHAVTAHTSDSLWGKYVPNLVNPVLSHRHLGRDYPIQATGHADLVQTQNGDWYAVSLGKRVVDGYSPLGRETFLSKVEFQNGNLIFNPGYGKVLAEQERPDLPWTPVAAEAERDDFEASGLSPIWYFNRIPQTDFFSQTEGVLTLSLQPQTIDELDCPALVMRKVKHHHFTAATKLTFQTNKDNEQAGLVLYRTANGYYSLLKGRDSITLIRKHLGQKEVVAQIPYSRKEVYLKISANGMDVEFRYGQTLDQMTMIGSVQSMDAVSDNKLNRFNGLGVGMYATSNDKESSSHASFDWFEYKAAENR